MFSEPRCSRGGSSGCRVFIHVDSSLCWDPKSATCPRGTETRTARLVSTWLFLDCVTRATNWSSLTPGISLPHSREESEGVRVSFQKRKFGLGGDSCGCLAKLWTQTLQDKTHFPCCHCGADFHSKCMFICTILVFSDQSFV